MPWVQTAVVRRAVGQMGSAAVGLAAEEAIVARVVQVGEGASGARRQADQAGSLAVAVKAARRVVVVKAAEEKVAGLPAAAVRVVPLAVEALVVCRKTARGSNACSPRYCS